MTRPSSRFRDACHGTLAATLLYLCWHLASSPAANTGSSLDVQARQRTLSPVALASWDVLAQTSLLALILFRLSDFLLRSELKETYEVSIKDLERFVSASAAGIWGTRHYILLLQMSSHVTAKASGNELAVLRATGLATVVLVLLTLCNIVTGDDGVEQMGTIVAPVTPCDEKSSEASPRTQLNRTPSAEELLGKANPLFRRITLIGCGLTAILVAMVALNDGHLLAIPLLVPVVFTFPIALFSRWLETPHLSLGLVASILVCFYPSIWYSTVSSLGPTGQPPWESLVWLSRSVGLTVTVWLASLCLSLRADVSLGRDPVSGLTQHARNAACRLHDVTLHRLLRAAPTIRLHDGQSDCPPDSPV